MSNRVDQPSEKIIALARKLKALVDGGVGGEKVNAEKMLNKLLSDHNITLEEIDGEKITEYVFPVRKEQKKLFFQIVSSVIGEKFDLFKRGRATNPIKYVLKITPSQAVEIYAKFDFFWPLLQKETKTLYYAFTMKHDLFPANSDGVKTEDLTKEQLETIRNAAKMQEGLSKQTFRKQLT